MCVRDFDRTRSLHSFCTWIPAFHSSSLGRSQNLLGEGWGEIIHPPLSLCFKWRIFWTLAVRLKGDNWVCRGEREALLRWRGEGLWSNHTPGGSSRLWAGARMDHSQREACHIRRERERTAPLLGLIAVPLLLLFPLELFNVLYWRDIYL